MRNRTRILSVFVSMLILGGVVLGSVGPASGRALFQTSSPVLVGEGDIAQCKQEEPEETAKLIERIDGTVFTLGDNAYNHGTHEQYDCYDQSWGRFKDRTRPVAGNHDYKTPGAEGYFTYFGAAASPLDLACTRDCKGYYSYDLGAWHIIVLNSNIEMKEESEQVQWLRADLEAHPTACTLAMWHEPRFSSGEHGNSGDVKVLWDVLYEHGADVVLNGHDHNYQRFAPQNPAGEADSKGIRQFIVGTGGGDHYGLRKKDKPNLEVKDNKSYGVLKLTLHPTSYDWEFIPIEGDTFTDLGASTCVTDTSEAVAIGTATPVPTPPAGEVTPFTPVTGQGPSFFEQLIAWLKQLFRQP